MNELKIGAIFGLILAAASAIAVTMGALLLQFQAPGDQAVAWRSVVVALGGVGVALSLVCLLHVALVFAGLIATSAETRRVQAWLGRWAAVASGDAPPVAVTAGEQRAASQAAALILQDMSGEAAAQIRNALQSCGLIAGDMARAESGREWGQGERVAALERLAWLAAPAALPLFYRAVLSANPRTVRAGVLGACRTLASAAEPGETGKEVLACIEAYADSTFTAGHRPFLSAALAGAGTHTGWLCAELLARPLPDALRAATLDALGATRPESAARTVAAALAGGLEGETLAAALRALSQLGTVPNEILASVRVARLDRHDGVRVQAAHALVGAPPRVAFSDLWGLLADPTFEVRFAAAKALAACGAAGEDELNRAAASHPDPFARDMAAMVRRGPNELPDSRNEESRVVTGFTSPTAVAAKA